MTKVATKWVVRKPNGQMFACPDQSTLQTWIVEGRIHRDDCINGDGRAWHRLGDSRVLAPFFEAYDRAVLADEITRRDSGPPPKVQAIDTNEWMKRGERKRRLDPNAFDKLGVEEKDDPDAERIVRRFRATRGVRNVTVWGMGMALLALALASIFALAGPENNPLRTFAETHGVLPGMASAMRAAESYRTAAQRFYDRGDIADLDRAIELLQRARALSKDDPSAGGDLALALCAKAEVLGRAASDLEKEAEDRAASGDKQAAERLRVEALEKRSGVGGLLTEAKAVLADVQKRAPNALETQRASSDYFRLIGDDAQKREWIERAHVTLAADHAYDPWTALIDAKILEGDVEKATAKALNEARTVLTEALAKDPALWRASLDLARIALAQGEYDEAQRRLAQILGQTPSHAEAQRLMRQVTQTKAKADESRPS